MHNIRNNKETKNKLENLYLREYVLWENMR